MKSCTLQEEMKGVAAAQAPAITLILPFDPKMSSKSEVEQRLKMAIGKAERELILNYTAEKAMPLISKLQQIAKGLNYNTHKKSIAIFLSQDLEKVFYLDIPVEERIVIDESFEIRDLIYSKKQMKMYLVLTLSARNCKTYLGNQSELSLIKTNVYNEPVFCQKDVNEKPTHFSGPDQQKEIQLDHFLRLMDEGLRFVLRAYPFPVFVLGSEQVLAHFRMLTHNGKHIVGFVEGNFNDATEPVIRTAMKGYLGNWKEMKEKAIMQELEASAAEKKLAIGLEQAWEAARHKNSRLLIVEKGYHHPISPENQGNTMFRQSNANVPLIHGRDVVEEIMEKVLEAGGDIEFVDDGWLDRYGRIVLLKYY